MFFFDSRLLSSDVLKWMTAQRAMESSELV